MSAQGQMHGVLFLKNTNSGLGNLDKYSRSLSMDVKHNIKGVMLNCLQRAGSNQESKRFHFAKSQLQKVSDLLSQ